jgi:hemolysin activation/secretion protein
VRLSPGGTHSFPYRYGQTNFIARFYVTPGQGPVTVGLRVVGDAQFGHPPFYEMARYEDTFALGGAKGVRGVPAQRYYGRIKFFANLEGRCDLTSFRFLGKTATLIGAAFFDAGRVFSDWPPNTSLDGSGLGLKYGMGAGLRLLQGKAFVVRGDIAWSPDARPIGGYFTAGQSF